MEENPWWGRFLKNPSEMAWGVLTKQGETQVWGAGDHINTERDLTQREGKSQSTGKEEVRKWGGLGAHLIGEISWARVQSHEPHGWASGLSSDTQIMGKEEERHQVNINSDTTD